MLRNHPKVVELQFHSSRGLVIILPSRLVLTQLSCQHPYILSLPLSWKSALQTLAALHRISPKAIGLEDYGKPSGFYPRQLKGLTKVTQMQSQAPDSKTGEKIGPIPGFDKMVGWLSENMPEDEMTVSSSSWVENFGLLQRR